MYAIFNPLQGGFVSPIWTKKPETASWRCLSGSTMAPFPDPAAFTRW